MRVASVLKLVAPETSDREVIFTFFSTFSLFECALKRTRYIRKVNPKAKDRSAHPDWDRFAKDLEGRFRVVSDLTFHAAVGALKAAPPKKQIVVNDRLQWQVQVPGPGETDEAYVLRLVRTVRNNLFHGGKHPSPDGPILESARDHALLEQCVLILDTCIRLWPDLAGAIEDVA